MQPVLVDRPSRIGSNGLEETISQPKHCRCNWGPSHNAVQIGHLAEVAQNLVLTLDEVYGPTVEAAAPKLQQEHEHRLMSMRAGWSRGKRTSSSLHGLSKLPRVGVEASKMARLSRNSRPPCLPSLLSVRDIRSQSSRFSAMIA